MRYKLLDLEVTRALPRVELEPDQTGVGVLVRRDDRPVDFFLAELPSATVLEPDETAALVSRSSARLILEEAVRRELDEPPAHPVEATFTVAVCTRDRIEDLTRCLESILALRGHDAEPRFDVLVVDNAPSDSRTEALVRTLPRVAYVREPKPGLDFARNRALAEATGDFVAFVDDDTVLDRGWFEGLLEAVGENPDAAIVTGAVVAQELETEAQILFEHHGGFRRDFEKLRYQGPELPGNPLYPVGAGLFGAGANMVVRREAVLALGGFDEALDTGPPLPGGGDLDIFYRVVNAGLPLVYEPRMLLFHKHRRDLDGLRRQYWTWGTGFMAFVSKTYAAEPAQRAKLRRLLRWWFGYHVRELRGTIPDRGARPAKLVVTEVAGGVAGLAGTYRRSVRRTRAIARRES